jgi:hypothetical protein
MGTASKSLVLLIVALFLTSLIVPQIVTVKAQASNPNSSIPPIVWEKQYGDAVARVSNLIQTTDGGYAFLDLGWTFQGYFEKPTIYKVDSLGNVQWTKTIDFQTSTIVQTSDGGYQISGNWLTWGYREPNALIKTDSQGNIEWNVNYSNPNMVPNLNIASTNIPTTDGGFAYIDTNIHPTEFSSAYLESSKLTKTNSNNQTIWSIPVTYTNHIQFGNFSYDDVYPLVLSSLIETSDGALAGIGVGHPVSDNFRIGSINLIKTEAFLPLPSPTQLPTPIPTPIPTPTSIGSLTLNLAIPIIAVVIIAVAVISALLFRRHRKPISQNKPTFKEKSIN